MDNDYKHAADLFATASDLLESARQHCIVAAARFNGTDPSSGNVHALAAMGQLELAQERLKDFLVLQASKTSV